MRLLLDTHCWVWMESMPERFAADVRAMLEDAENTLLLSAACAWEIAINHARGKLKLPSAPSDYVDTRLRRTGTLSLPITHAHALRAGVLPRYHKDPFDRVLIAQAQLEGVRI